jgi:hypothetical protein
MTDLLPKLTGPAFRQDIEDLTKFRRTYDGKLTELQDARDTLYLVGDRKLIVDKMISRYARELQKSKDSETGKESYSIVPVVDRSAQAAILYGQYEIVRSMLFNSIVRALATLFSESGLQYTYSIGDKEESDVDLTAGMTKLRQYSGGHISTQRWDALSVGLGSSLLYISVNGDKLLEREVSPTAVWVVFGSHIEQDNKVRPVDETDMDDASVVVMMLASGSIGVDKNKYAAWIGPSRTYPLGRMVTYEAQNWHEIPDIGDEGSHDYVTSGGDIANPLSAWAQDRNDWTIPTYPFSVCYGDKMSSGLLPTSISLYEDCLELDLATSIVLGCSIRGAQGVQVIKQVNQGAGELPANTDGKVLLSYAYDLNQAGWATVHSKDAMEVIKEIARQKAEAYNVPGFLAASTGQERPSSGREVIARSEPLQRNRDERIQLNRASVMRRWEISKALINATNGNAKGTEPIPADTVENWMPGERKFMLDPLDELAIAEKEMQLGLETVVSVGKKLKNFDSLEAAANALADKQEIMDTFDRTLPTAQSAQQQQQVGRGTGRLFAPQ